jgi:hypothetical protein
MMGMAVEKSRMLDLHGSTEARCEAIPAAEATRYLKRGHYLGRIPSISFAFGLFRGGDLEGVCCYGTPPSAPLRTGICGPEWAPHVLELNRLFLVDNVKMDASWFVSRTLRLLPKPSIVVSFADPAAGHSGIIYRATNFIYCGLSAKRTDWKVRGKEHLHGQTIADEFRGVPDRASAMREKYGDDFYSEDRPRKHRFVYFVGSRKQRRQMRASLLWPVEEAA